MMDDKIQEGEVDQQQQEFQGTTDIMEEGVR